MISKFSKSKKITQKYPLNTKNPNKSIKYKSNQLFPELWPILSFDLDSDMILKFSKI